MVSDSVLGTVFAVCAHCAALVIAFHVASAHRDIPFTRGASTSVGSPTATPSRTLQLRSSSSNKRATRSRSPLIGTPSGYLPPTNRSSSSTSPVPTVVANSATSEADAAASPLVQNAMQTPPTSRPPPYQGPAAQPLPSQSSSQVVVPAVDLAQLAYQQQQQQRYSATTAVLEATPLSHTVNTFSDDELTCLIENIQNDPLSHARWKELRKWLLMQRHEERQRGRRRQSELPVVCFSEDPELVSLQVEVRSLIARERVRYPIGCSRQISQQSVVGSTGPPTPISSRTTLLSTPTQPYSGRLPHSSHRMSRGVRLAYEGPPVECAQEDDDYYHSDDHHHHHHHDPHNLTAGSATTISLLASSSPPAQFPPRARSEGGTSAVLYRTDEDIAGGGDVEDEMDEEELENQLYEQLCERMSRNMTLRRSVRHIAEVYQGLRIEEASEDGASTTAGMTPRDALLSARSAIAHHQYHQHAHNNTPRQAVASSTGTEMQPSLFPIMEGHHHHQQQQQGTTMGVVTHQPGTNHDDNRTNVAAPNAVEQIPGFHEALSQTQESRTNPHPYAPPLSSTELNVNQLLNAAVDDSSEDALAQFVQHRVVALRNHPAFTKIESDETYRPFVRDFLRLEDQLRRLSENVSLGGGGGGTGGEPQQQQLRNASSTWDSIGGGPSSSSAASAQKRPWNYGRVAPKVGSALPPTSAAHPKKAASTSAAAVYSRHSSKVPSSSASFTEGDSFVDNSFSAATRQQQSAVVGRQGTTTKQQQHQYPPLPRVATLRHGAVLGKQTDHRFAVVGSSSPPPAAASSESVPNSPSRLNGDSDSRPRSPSHNHHHRSGGGTMFHSALPPLTTVSLSKHNNNNNHNSQKSGSNSRRSEERSDLTAASPPQPFQRSMTYSHHAVVPKEESGLLALDGSFSEVSETVAPSTPATEGGGRRSQSGGQGGDGGSASGGATGAAAVPHMSAAKRRQQQQQQQHPAMHFTNSRPSVPSSSSGANNNNNNRAAFVRRASLPAFGSGGK